MEKIVIVGGGVAGLSCLNALLDNGIPALLLEGQTVGTPKMCGEFLAPVVVSQLEQWGIGPITPVQTAVFHAKKNTLQINFPQHAGAFSRSAVEMQLAERARKLGGKIQEHTRIKNITPSTANSPHILQLENGEIISAQFLFVAMGKSPQSELPYVGLKTHLPYVIKQNTLQMFSHKNCYFGIVPVAADRSNLACLLKCSVIQQAGSAKDYLRQLAEHSELNHLFSTVDIDQLSILEGKAPHFGLRAILDWPNALWIGDALAAFPPAIGYGFAHSIVSALMAVECFLEGDINNYHKKIQQSLRLKLITGKVLHHTLLKPNLGSVFLPIFKKQPFLVNFIMARLFN